MKPKPNWSEIENRIDFGSVSEKLAQFAASGGGRRKTVSVLLDKVKDALLEARSNGASYRALAAFLTESGLPVSEPTLRQYLRTQGAEKPRKKTRSVAKPVAKPSAPEAQPQQTSPVASPKVEAQPASEGWKPRTEPDESSESRRRRGPRIADPSTL